MPRDSGRAHWWIAPQECRVPLPAARLRATGARRGFHVASPFASSSGSRSGWFDGTLTAPCHIPVTAPHRYRMRRQCVSTWRLATAELDTNSAESFPTHGPASRSDAAVFVSAGRLARIRNSIRTNRRSTDTTNAATDSGGVFESSSNRTPTRIGDHAEVRRVTVADKKST